MNETIVKLATSIGINPETELYWTFVINGANTLNRQLALLKRLVAERGDRV